MPTEEDCSLISHSFESLEISSVQSSRKNASSIHEYCRKPAGEEPIRDNQNRKLYYCALCPYSASSTTNIRYHLQSKHEILADRNVPRAKFTASTQLQQLWKQALADNQSAPFDSMVLKNALNKDVVDQALLNQIVIRNLPFRAVEWPEFHTFCQALNPESVSFITTAHSEVSKLIAQSFQLQKDVVRKRIQSALTRIHLSVDVWTSPNNHLLLAVCGHFIDSQEDRMKALLGLRTIASHSGEKQWSALLPLLEDFGIVQKIGAIVADNSTTNDTLCRAISQHLNEKEEIWWDPSHERIRCQGHTINLIVQAFLFTEPELEIVEAYDHCDPLQEELTEETQTEKEECFREMGVLGRLHNIVHHTRSSAGRMNEFKALAGRMIPLDNSTRWNSWYRMIDVALEAESAIDDYVKANFRTLEKDHLSPQDWNMLRVFHGFLKPFDRATLSTQGGQATLDRLLFTLDVLGKHMEKFSAQHRSKKDIISRVQQAVKKFEEYYRKTDSSPFYAAAMILHPNQRTKYARLCWKKDYQKAVLPQVKELWTRYRDSSLPLNIVAYETPELNATRELDEFDLIAKEFRERVTRPASQDEYEDYCAEAPYEVQKSALQWWCEAAQRKRWPRLSMFAIDILSIPAMSDEPERVFSGGRRTVSWERMQIGMPNLERTECMKSWHRSGILAKEEG